MFLLAWHLLLLVRHLLLLVRHLVMWDALCVHLGFRGCLRTCKMQADQASHNWSNEARSTEGKFLLMQSDSLVSPNHRRPSTLLESSLEVTPLHYLLVDLRFLLRSVRTCGHSERTYGTPVHQSPVCLWVWDTKVASVHHAIAAHLIPGSIIALGRAPLPSQNLWATIQLSNERWRCTVSSFCRDHAAYWQRATLLAL